MASTNIQKGFSISKNETMQDNADYRIRVYHVADHQVMAKEYYECQLEVLKEFGVDNKVTSIKKEWWTQPTSYMFIAFEVNTNKMVAGMRLDVADPTHSIPLEDAIKHFSPDIVKRVHKHNHVLAEGCGWWSKKEHSGKNLPSHLLRAGIAIAPKIRIGVLVAFPHQRTIGIMEKLGFTIVPNIGDEGKFNYPDERYISTVVELDDTINLPSLNEQERKVISSLRSNPLQIYTEVSEERSIKIEYDLRLW